MSDRDLTICMGCGLHHPRVECVGIYYCPNVLCTSAGASWFRHRLSSFKEVENGRHTVDHLEIVEAAMHHVRTVETDEAIKAKILSSVTKWL